MRLRSLFRTTIAAVPILLLAAPASAHHLMGGKIPSTFAEGLLSGLGHPVIGADHLAFLVAVGVIVGVSRLSLMLPILFVAAMAVGVFAHVDAVTIPAPEFIVALSVLIVGLLMARGRAYSGLVWSGLFAVAGFFHGYAFGESIFGAERAPLGAYLLGLVIVQSALTFGIALLTRRVQVSTVLPRLIGAAIGGVGIAALLALAVPAPPV
jgi:urease accessory protein